MKSLLFIATIVILVLTGQGDFHKTKKTWNMENSQNTPRKVKGRYQNDKPTEVMQGMSLSTLKAFIRKGEKVPEKPLPVVPFDKTLYENPDKEKLSVVWFGHSCALIQVDGLLILTDPALSKNAGPTSFTGTKRFHKQVPVTVSELPELNVVLISHDHFDHLDKATIKKLEKKTQKFIVPSGVAKYLEKWGIDKNKITERSWWEEYEYQGTKFISTPARHFSGRGLFDRNRTLWTSWVIVGEKHRVYFSGDSGYQKAFKTIGEKYGPFDLSLLECGQYNADWGLIHMSPEESIQAAHDTKSRLALPIHWGAFNLSVHAWYDPIERFKAQADATGQAFVTPKIGERLVINGNLQPHNWWKEHMTTQK